MNENLQEGIKILDEKICLIIDKIKYSGFASIEYWIIVFTDKAVYFCNTQSNYGYGGFGVLNEISYALGDSIRNNRAVGETDINLILSRSKRYYRFGKKELDLINFKKGIVKNIIIINTNKKKIRIKVNSKKYNKFLEQLKCLKGI